MKSSPTRWYSARVLGGIAAALTYAFVLIPLSGFIVASLVLLVTLALLGERQPLRSSWSCRWWSHRRVWLLFEKALGVTLPPGHVLTGWIGG
ncbi:MAG: hypothetical protein R3E68_00660 [Burkholderiaceae bacterium]